MSIPEFMPARSYFYKNVLRWRGSYPEIKHQVLDMAMYRGQNEDQAEI